MSQTENKQATIVAFQNHGSKKTMLGRILYIKGSLYYIEDLNGNIGAYCKENFVPLIQSNLNIELHEEVRINNQKIINAMLDRIGNLIGI